ncbi:MAG: Nudix family hydrolase [Gammaproteobacteria bacterium]|nr:Nudix family hydrolase [Gammaproteobacteria bacterium]
MSLSTPNTAPDTRKRITVVAGVIQDSAGRVLIARRHNDAHQGGKWEFPGGKLEVGESLLQALARELEEELGIHIQKTAPLISIQHDYSDKSISLHVFRVNDYLDCPRSLENQPLAWCWPDELNPENFPAANVPIIHALQLPPVYVVSADCKIGEETEFIEVAKSVLQNGAKLLQLRCPSLPKNRFISLAQTLKNLCETKSAKLMLNMPPDEFDSSIGHGLHLSSHYLHAINKNTLTDIAWVSAACHDVTELQRATELGVNFALISPVCVTRSHAEKTPLGWEKFAELTAQANFPIYALGGMNSSMIKEVQALGAQGVAGISAFWKK